ncbi:hypothetical protein [Sphingobacterium corticibacter]|uniref:Uncharacterized protein n=1 Tax=Sphingobacterium corticibacter TaxID=2171749 RepID=A0A2T8HIY9_9SPHI|nr:hypothetical protein [Sphingobacterium corticibacter]PVH25417.1 hypothetical protein DC487_10930 [Sphingobacterium corticibacter]
MKFVTYQIKDKNKLGLYLNGVVIDLHDADASITESMKEFLADWNTNIARAKVIADSRDYTFTI